MKTSTVLTQHGRRTNALRLGHHGFMGFLARLPIALFLFHTGAATVSATDLEQRQYSTKYSPLAQITRENVADLELAWEYHTGEIDTVVGSLVAFEDEPLLIEGNLVVCTISRRLIALDPVTGKKRWIYDPESTANKLRKCRGIAAWADERAEEGQQCKTRLFLGTADYRLVAIDAKDGRPCAGFGDHGVVTMEPSKPEIMVGEVSALSRPAIVNGVVVVGSAITDDQRLDAPSGRVLAFDARTGEPRWEFDPLPRDPNDPAARTWLKGSAGEIGGGNVWAAMSVDEKLDLVYLPTSSPSVDFYGAARPGDNLYADSVVALRGTTGQVAWYFQLVHHNIWDYDTPTAPLLIDYPRNGEMVPALVQNTKTGQIYVFDRETGEPLVPIEERPVPQQGAVSGEWLAPTQPFPVGMPGVTPLSFAPEDVWGFTPLDEWLCRREVETLVYGPIYTPVSERGTIVQPGVAGGPNWGGGAYDPDSHIMVVASARVPMVVSLVRRENANVDQFQALETGAEMLFPNAGVPYVTKISPLLSPFGAPCSAPPWAVLTAVDIVKKQIVWEVPLGSIEKLAPLPIPWMLGTPGAGAPLVTAGGLVFIGYSLDHKVRAFDLHSGDILWEAEMPAPGNSTPVTYQMGGEQYVVIPAGGHSMYGTRQSDAVMAYRLRR